LFPIYCGSATLNIVAKVSLTGSYSNTACIAGINSDPVSANNCSTVTPIPINSVVDAVNDIGTSVNGYTGGIAFTNVLSNDTLNGIAVIPSQVNTTFVSSTNPGITLSGTNVVVAPGTPAGSYTLTYQICEVLNPTNCDTAVVRFTVTAAIIQAVHDDGTSIIGALGGQSLANVLVNDTLNGSTAMLTTVNLTQISTTNTGVTLDPATGTVNVAAGTPSGTYTVTYQICEKLNPTN